MNGTEKIKYNQDGLVPAIIQDNATNAVLMLAYMNEDALHKTIETGYTWFYSRSRSRLWHKGETSGHTQKVTEMFYDCDADTLLLKVEQTGNACHEGTFSCFSRKLTQNENSARHDGGTVSTGDSKSKVASIIYELYDVVNERRQNPKEGSYTSYLFDKGQDKILKKIGEESAETIIASKNNNNGEILYEMADLWYHCLVLLSYHRLAPAQLMLELKSRRK